MFKTENDAYYKKCTMFSFNKLDKCIILLLLFKYDNNLF